MLIPDGKFILLVIIAALLVVLSATQMFHYEYVGPRGSDASMSHATFVRFNRITGTCQVFNFNEYEKGWEPIEKM